jgi:anthranilate synthase component 1
LLKPDISQFLQLCAQGAPVPVCLEFLSDTDTAVTAYARLARPPFGFLLESLVGGEKWARYTFLGTRPRSAWRLAAGGLVSTWSPDHGWSEPEKVTDPLADLADRLGNREPVEIPGLPRFVGGAVGYLGYDVVRYIERLPTPPPDPLGLPEALFIFTDVVLAIDNVFGRAMALTTVDPAGLDEPSLHAAYEAAAERLEPR